MRGKPNPIWHMLKWGMGSGVILAMLFGAMLTLIYLVNLPPESLTISSIFLSAVLLLFGGFFFGVIAGLILGIVDGFFLSYIVVRNTAPPYTQSAKNIHYIVAYISIFILNLFMGISLLLQIFGVDAIFIWTIPPLIAAITGVYATDSYLKRLHTWASQFEKPKRKLKHDATIAQPLADTHESDAMLDSEVAPQKDVDAII